ncbi:MAG TPA: hypothetical protein VM536_18100 [Chloroflexia bacterium]|nr:hypothetical protein [Chloroflexia bacterium]
MKRRWLGGMLVLAVLVMAGVMLASTAVVRPAELAAPSVSGRLAYASGGNIWVWHGGASQITRHAPGSTEYYSAPSLSADGSRVAYVRFDDSFSDILVGPSSGGSAQALTDYRPPAETGSPAYIQAAIWALFPDWAPDGTPLAFASDMGFDAPVLWIMTAGGDSPHSLQTSPPNPPIERPRWSPTGDDILATSLGSGRAEVWRLDLESSTWSEVAAPADGAYDGTWSPDGVLVAYAARSGRATDIWLVPADRSTPPVQLTHLGRARAPAFSPDGKQLAFLAEKDDQFQVFVADFSMTNGSAQLGTPQQLTSAAGGVDASGGLSWSK